jgi:hypothetical protein
VQGTPALFIFFLKYWCIQIQDEVGDDRTTQERHEKCEQNFNWNTLGSTTELHLENNGCDEMAFILLTQNNG